MKLGSRWVCALGVIFIVSNLFTLAGSISNPPDLQDVFIVGIVNSVLWSGFGAFLIALYLKYRKPKSASIEAELVANSTEDIERLKRRQLWFFTFVLLVSAIGSAESWMLNNYLAGFTPINISIVFDVVSNIVLLGTLLQLHRGKSSLKILLCEVVVYSIGLASIYFWRGMPLIAVSNVLTIIYFAYAILSPVNRRNQFVAHAVILPIVVALFFMLISIDGMKLNKLIQEEKLLDQQYTTELSTVDTKYSLYLQRENPSADDIQAVQDATARWRVASTKDVAAIAEIRALKERELPSISQKLSLDYWRKIMVIVDLNNKQIEAIEGLMTYSKQLNFDSLSVDQRAKVKAFKDSLVEIDNELTAARFELNKNAQ